MAGRVKRKAGLAAAQVRTIADEDDCTDVPRCALCNRPLGERVEWHHLVPRSEGGRETAAVHPICHRTIHAAVSNVDLAREYAAPEALRMHPAIARFLRWIAGKPADFHAPVRRGRVRV